MVRGSCEQNGSVGILRVVVAFWSTDSYGTLNGSFKAKMPKRAWCWQYADTEGNAVHLPFSIVLQTSLIVSKDKDKQRSVGALHSTLFLFRNVVPNSQDIKQHT